MNDCQAIPFGQQGQTFQDRILGMMPTIEDGADGFDKGTPACPALIPLSSGLGPSKPADVATPDLTIFGTTRIPAKRAGMHEVCLFHSCSSAYRWTVHDTST